MLEDLGCAINAFRTENPLVGAKHRGGMLLIFFAHYCMPQIVFAYCNTKMA